MLFILSQFLLIAEVLVLSMHKFNLSVYFAVCSPLILSSLFLELESGGTNLVDLVEALGPWLVDLDKECRVHGTKVLSEVLKLLPVNFLSADECQLLTTFFCDRLNDHYTVVPVALTGIASLVSVANKHIVA